MLFGWSRSDNHQTLTLRPVKRPLNERKKHAFAPGTGTPEIAGMSTREMVNVIRGLSGLKLISADVVEVSPAYDHAEVTSLAAATIIYELTNLFAKVKG